MFCHLHYQCSIIFVIQFTFLQLTGLELMSESENKSTDEVNNEVDTIKLPKTYFVSGHLDVSCEEFISHYKSMIDHGIEEKARFVVGDARGVDIFAQQYLDEVKKIHPDLQARITVYHMFDKPRNNVGNFPTRGGFTSDESRDQRMTLDSTDDILWIRPENEMKKLYGTKFKPGRISGTEKNKLRRDDIKNNNS
jgi:hypothetical protein